ncbi:MAG: CHAD domain-containing protein [Actinomycetales bacterium]|jgi:triphosphatase|nr:CHAD domain-containing protein [Candidatus Phosphoribacter baldrii]
MTHPTKAPALLLSPRIGGGQAFETVARLCLEHADANEPLVDVHGDHEAVHQFRVAYRRLRSLFSLAREVSQTDPEAARIKANLRELTVAFGPARDLDVFREGHPDLSEANARRLEKARVTAYADALDFLHSATWQQTRTDLDAWLSEGTYRDLLGTGTWSGRVWTAGALERRRKRIRTMGRKLAKLSDHERHLVRIEAKKVRYGCQFFGSMWPANAAEVTVMEKQLGALQDRLGALNDLATWSRLVKLARLKGMEPPSVDVPAELAAAQETADRIAALPAFWESTLQR